MRRRCSGLTSSAASSGLAASCGALSGQFGAIASEADLLAGHALARFDDAGHRDVVQRGDRGRIADHGVPERVDAALSHPTAHLRLVLGCVGRAPVLARQAEVAGGDCRGGLQVIAVREQGGGLAVASRDRIDDRHRIEDVARDDFVRIGGEAALRKMRAMRVGAVGQQDDREPERPGGGQEALVDGCRGNVRQDEECLHG